MNPLRGIVLKVLSALVFTLMSVGLKVVASRYPTGQLVFFRSFFAILPLLIWLGWQGNLIGSIRTRNITGHFIRSFMGTASMVLTFGSLAYLPVHDSIAIGYASPLMVVILAAIILKEQVRAYRWSAVAIGFVGVIIMLVPYMRMPFFSGGIGNAETFGATLAFGGAITTAIAMIQVRRLTLTEQTGAIVLYFFLMSSALALFTVPFGWSMPPWDDFLLLVACGIAGGIGQILMTQSYRHADTSIIAPFEYTSMIWAILLGWFMFGDLPGQTVIIGALIVIASGIFVVWRERQLGLSRAKELASSPQRAGG